MSEVTITGIDWAKRVFQLPGARNDGSVGFRKKLSRDQSLAFVAQQPKCMIAMEACATAHGWGREFEKLGHDVRLIPPTYVKPFIKHQKMGWLPPCPDGIAMCQGSGVQRQKKERTANERYNDRGGPSKERFPTPRCHDDGTPAISKEADSDAISVIHVDPTVLCGRDGGVW